ncbi:MAG TPA: RNA 2',3'-cyclic phosphodiesterase [Casimicrobiaceae bacterium]|nr:RNA 2',3'-cyclic phosphodiesterase [Casimicrobiaceae bacterium]
MEAPAQRLFFAVWPDAPARAALARLASEVAHVVQGRAPRSDSLHVTLAFLGNVDADRLPAVLAAGKLAAGGVDPFDLALERMGGTAYGIAWISPGRVPDALRSLHGALAAALEQAGFQREQRMFRPHVTLARDGVRRAQQGALPPIAWTVDRLALVASTPGPGGSRYADVAGWPLQRGA